MPIDIKNLVANPEAVMVFLFFWRFFNGYPLQWLPFLACFASAFLSLRYSMSQKPSSKSYAKKTIHFRSYPNATATA